MIDSPLSFKTERLTPQMNRENKSENLCVGVVCELDSVFFCFVLFCFVFVFFGWGRLTGLGLTLFLLAEGGLLFGGLFLVGLLVLVGWVFS
ncbi:MAG: hypothetical protein ACOX5I_04725 [Gleimia sp.]